MQRFRLMRCVRFYEHWDLKKECAAAIIFIREFIDGILNLQPEAHIVNPTK